MDARHEQGFAGVDVSHADDEVGIHDGLFDGGLSASEPRGEGFGREVVAQGFGTEVAKQGVIFRTVVDELDRAEAAWIVEAELATRFETDGEVIVLAEGGGRPGEAEAAGHAQMDEQRAGFGAEEEVLGAAAAGFDDVSFQIVDVVRDGPAESGIAHDDLCDAFVSQVGPDAAQRGFDLRELGHDANQVSPWNWRAPAPVRARPAWRTSRVAGIFARLRGAGARPEHRHWRHLRLR